MNRHSASNAEWPPDLTDRLRALKRRGFSVPEISREMQLSRSTIYGKLWRLGLSATAGEFELVRQPGRQGPRRAQIVGSTLPPLASELV